MLIGVALLPYLLANLGVGRLGVLTLVWAFIGYFSIFDFGLGRALTYTVSSLKVQGQMDRAVGSIKAGMLLLVLIGCLGATAISAVVVTFGIGWLNVNPKIDEETYRSILIASAAIPLTTITSGLKGALEGFERFKAANILRTTLGISNFAIPAVTVAIYGPDLTLIVLGLLLARLAVMLMHFAVLERILRPLRSGHVFSRKESRDLAKFGAWMSVSNVLSPLMVVSDRFVISHFVGGSSVAYYSVPLDCLFRLLIIPGALTATLFPAFAQRLISPESGRIELQRLYGRALRVIAMLMLPVTLGIAVLSHAGLNLWLGKAFADNAYVVVIIIAFGIFFNGMAQVPHTMIQASGDVKKTSLVHVGEIVVYMPAMVYLVINFGIVGAALAWQLRVMADFFVLHALATRKLRHAVI